MPRTLNIVTNRLVFLTLALTLVSLGIHFLKPGLLTPHWPGLLFLFTALTYFLFLQLLKAEKQKFSRFVNTFMLSSMLKIFLLLVIIVAYDLTHPREAMHFSITLLVYYFIYLFFEAYWLTQVSRNKKQ